MNNLSLSTMTIFCSRPEYWKERLFFCCSAAVCLVQICHSMRLAHSLAGCQWHFSYTFGSTLGSVKVVIAMAQSLSMWLSRTLSLSFSLSLYSQCFVWFCLHVPHVTLGSLRESGRRCSNWPLILALVFAIVDVVELRPLVICNVFVFLCVTFPSCFYFDSPFPVLFPLSHWGVYIQRPRPHIAPNADNYNSMLPFKGERTMWRSLTQLANSPTPK
jgi:hypothetical protein